jgi:sulfatase modifying factor 1
MGDHHGDGAANEQPVHPVFLDPFNIGTCPTTNLEYAAFLNSASATGLITVLGGTVYKAGDDEPYCDTYPTSSESRIVWDEERFSVILGKEHHPVVLVSWYGAAAFANWLSDQEQLTPAYDLETWECDFTTDGYRLPTEAEWECAARGGEYDPYYRFPWGDEIDGTKANYLDSGDPFESEPLPGTTPIGYFNGAQLPSGYSTANGYGLFDASGNTWEWTNDWHSDTYYSVSPQDNPTGPIVGDSRNIRSGSWNSSEPEHYLRCAVRTDYYPHLRWNHVGFRIAQSVHPCPADIDGDGVIGLADLGALLSDYGANCP